MTKRQIGYLFILAALLGVVGIAVLDIIRRKSPTPLQAAALAVCLLLAIMGAALVPLRDRPA